MMPTCRVATLPRHQSLNSPARRNAAWSTASSVAVSASTFIQFAMCGRLLGVEELGRLSLIWAVVTPISLAFSLSLRLVLQTRQLEGQETRHLWAVRLLTLPLMMLCVAVVSGAIGQGLLFGALLLAASKAIDGVRDFEMGLALASHRYRDANLPLIAQSILQAVFFGGTLLATRNLSAGLAISLLVLSPTTLAMTWLTASMIDREILLAPVFSSSSAKRWLRRTWPLSLTALVGSGTVYVPRLALERFSNVADVGLYTAAASIATLPNVVLAGLAQAPLSARPADGNLHLRRLVRRVAAYAVMLCLATLITLTVAGSSILGLVYGNEFRAASNLLLILSASVVAGSPVWALDSGLIQLGAYRQQLLATLIGLFTLAALTAILVASLGLTGAGWAAVLAAALITVIKGALFERRSRIQ